MSPVGCEDLGCVQSLRGCNYSGVYKPDLEISVLSQENFGSDDVFRLELFDHQFSIRDRSNECRFGLRGDSSVEEIADFGQNADGNSYRLPILAPPIDHTLVPCVASIY